MPELQDYAREVRDVLFDAEIRADVDESDNRLNAKIRSAVSRKIPLIVVVGRREVENRSVTVRYRSGEERSLSLDEFLAHVLKMIATKDLAGAGHLGKAVSAKAAADRSS